MRLLILAAFIASAAAATLAAPFQCQVDKIAKHCNDLIKDNIENLPGFVRLAFHDCVGENGCNGCLDLSNGDNAGMKVYMDRLEDKYDENKIQDVMSRADFWVLCSHVAINIGAKFVTDAESLQLEMKFGRQDCNADHPDQSAPTDKYPSPHGTYAMSTDFFKAEFGLTANETVALIGAHTLGRARKPASGFRNPWVDGEYVFDNAFYQDILNASLDWVQVDLDGNDNETDHLQWSQNKTGKAFNMMLNADMSLAFDINSDASKKETRSYGELGDSPGKPLVQIYAESNKIWLEDFSVAYTKMVEKTLNIQLMAAQPDGENSPCEAPEKTTPSSSSTLFPSFLLCIAIAMVTKLFY